MSSTRRSLLVNDSDYESSQTTPLPGPMLTKDKQIDKEIENFSSIKATKYGLWIWLGVNFILWIYFTYIVIYQHGSDVKEKEGYRNKKHHHGNTGHLVNSNNHKNHGVLTEAKKTHTGGNYVTASDNVFMAFSNGKFLGPKMTLVDTTDKAIYVNSVRKNHEKMYVRKASTFSNANKDQAKYLHFDNGFRWGSLPEDEKGKLNYQFSYDITDFDENDPYVLKYNMGIHKGRGGRGNDVVWIAGSDRKMKPENRKDHAFKVWFFAPTMVSDKDAVEHNNSL